MAKNVDALLDNMTVAEQQAALLVHGIAWRQKLRARILTEWQSLPLHKRIFWTLRGKRPVI